MEREENVTNGDIGVMTGTERFSSVWGARASRAHWLASRRPVVRTGGASPSVRIRAESHRRDAGGGDRDGRAPLSESVQPRDQMVELLAVTPAERQPGAVVQNDDRVTVKKRLPFLHPFQVHQRRAAEPKEFFRGEPRFGGPHRFPKKIRGFADMRPQIVSLGFDPIDLIEFQENSATGFTDDQPLPGF